MDTINVVLAEDHHVVRAAVAEFLAKEPDIQVVGQVAEGGPILFDMISQLQPDVLVLDAHMPGHKVVESAQFLQAQHPEVHILVLSAYDRREYVEGLLRAGAVGYVLKDDLPESLLQAVRAAAKGQPWLSAKAAAALWKSARTIDLTAELSLTPRELEVLQLMADGRRNEEIAAQLFLSIQTVKNHVRSIYSKLAVESRVEAVLYAQKMGIVSG
ncbi:MAG: response regulator transcription factor [Anaerolineae bacterium]|nr:response regulator transcription factor [Anaerolineae bacterium]